MSAPRRRTLALAGVVVVAVGLAVSAGRVARVPDADMSPSLFPGELVLVWPAEPRAGDVVAVVDPLDPDRWTLRRVESLGGAVSFRSHSFRTSDGDRHRVLDMGEHGGHPVYLDGEHVIYEAPSPTRLEREAIGVPDDAAYLSADNRDAALDSRWWGPVPLEAVQGVVLVRFGTTSTPWRGLVGTRGEPAVLPELSKLGRR